MRLRITAFILALGAFVWAVLAQESAPPPDKSADVVALVDGEPITKEDFFNRLVADYGDVILRNMISLVLLEQEAKRLGITVTNAEVEERYQFLKGQVEKGIVVQLLMEAGAPIVSLQTMRAEAKKVVLLEKILHKELAISEGEIKAYFWKNYARFNEPPRYLLSEIGVLTQAEAQQILKTLERTPPRQRKAKFEELARTHSVLGSSSLEPPGMVGAVSAEDLPPELNAKLARAENNSITGPFRVDYGGRTIWFIIWLHKKMGGRKRYATDPDVQEEIRAELIRQKLATVGVEYIAKLWDKNYDKIKVLIPEIDISRPELKKKKTPPRR